MDSLFLWELGTPKVYLIWLLVLAAQIAVAEINRRWNWTIFAAWTVGGIALMPYAWIHGTPMVGWFPFGKYAIMILTATMTGTVLVYAKRNPVKAHKYAIWLGVALWIGLAVNIMEANIRDLTIWFNADAYYACGADWQCLKGVNDAHTIDMIAGLPEARGVSAELHSQQWYQEVAANLAARHVGIDPETGFRTIGGYWNLLSAAAGLLNIITITGLGKIIVTSPGKCSVRGLIWVDMVWPWVIAYDLWNHAFLYNSLADYTWYCTLALLLACTIPAFTWAKGAECSPRRRFRDDPRVHVGEGPVDLVPLLHAGLLDLHEHPPARGLGPSLGHLQLRDHGPARQHRVCGPGAHGQCRVVRLLAVQDHCLPSKPDHGRPVLRAGRVPHHRARALR